MTNEPKILEKVEELSDEIADFIVDPEYYDNPIEVADVSGFNLEILFKPDFKVAIATPDKSYCSCNYGGEEIRCPKDSSTYMTVIEGKDRKPKDQSFSLFDDCKVRHYAELGVAGFRRQKPQE
jgi:hypothetical protein